jgi:hypothetical protein
MGDLIDTLRDAAGNPDHDIRTAAMQKLETAESGQYVNFMVALCKYHSNFFLDTPILSGSTIYLVQ